MCLNLRKVIFGIVQNGYIDPETNQEVIFPTENYYSNNYTT